MISPLSLVPLSPADGADYGLARVRDIAFDAVVSLWNCRRSKGMTQKEIAQKIGVSTATVCRNLGAPGNWTMRTLGELVYALDGDIEIIVVPKETVKTNVNSSAYDDYMPQEYYRNKIEFFKKGEQARGLNGNVVTIEKISG